jgi:hypothetical protein
MASCGACAVCPNAQRAAAASPAVQCGVVRI